VAAASSYIIDVDAGARPLMSARRGFRLRALAVSSMLLLPLLFVATAHAEEAARFAYTRGPGAESCPDESALRQAVAARLGTDPFQDDPRAVRVAVEKTPRGFSATIEIRAPDGTLRGERALASRASTCTELASALAAALSVAFERPRVPAPEAAPPPSVAPATTPDATPPPPVAPVVVAAPTPAPGPKLHAETSLASGGAFGAAPGGALSFLASVAVAGSSASLGLEGRTDLPASASAAGGVVSSSIVMGSVVPCFRRGAVGLCALGAIGSLRGKGEGVQTPTTASALYVAAGVRLLVEVPIDAGLFFRAGGDLETTLKGVRLVLDGHEAWTTPFFSGVLWAGVAFHSP
jgi:hypothetical protein